MATSNKALSKKGLLFYFHRRRNSGGVTLRLKLGRDIVWNDLPKIESPLHAIQTVKYGDPIRGQLKNLDILNPGSSFTRKTQARELINALEKGRVYFLTDTPSSPVFRWVEKSSGKGYWQLNGSYGLTFNMSAEYMLRNVAKDHYYLLGKMGKGLTDGIKGPDDLLMPAQNVGIKAVSAKTVPKTTTKISSAQRIAKLDNEGHAPIRHGGPNRVTDTQLEDRAVRGIDPASGTTFDAFNKYPDGSPKPHKVGRNATAFVSDKALVKADDAARKSAQFQENVATARANGDMFVDPVELPLKDVYGPGYKGEVRGLTRLGSKKHPIGHMDTDFTDGTIKAIYRLDESSDVKLHTLYPNPKPKS